MFIKKGKEAKVNGIVGRNCCRVISNKVIKKDNPAKIYSMLYTYYPN